MAATEPDHVRLYLPGPVEVHPDILAEMARPMIGHRQQAYRDVHKAVRAGLQWMLSTANDVLISTSSATGVWESCARNGTKKGVLVLTNGNFSERWEETIKLCGKPFGTYAVEWGKAHRAEEVERHLATGKYDAVAIVHSETSTGVLDPLEEICAAARRFDDVHLWVDAVSSAGSTAIEVDRLGIDVLLVGVQKAMGIPPGLAFFSLSKRALERSKTVADRGYYFNWEILAKHSEKDETPATPPVSQMVALKKQLERMKAEGLAQRFARHQAMAERARGWAKERGFDMFPEAPYYAQGLTCVKNTRGADVAKMHDFCLARGMAIDQGYGKLKGKTFRIAHMGDMTLAQLDELLAAFDEFLGAGK